jgi:hypothetical protein
MPEYVIHIVLNVIFLLSFCVSFFWLIFDEMLVLGAIFGEESIIMVTEWLPKGDMDTIVRYGIEVVCFCLVLFFFFFSNSDLKLCVIVRSGMCSFLFRCTFSFGLLFEMTVFFVIMLELRFVVCNFFFFLFFFFWLSFKIILFEC